MGDRSPAPVALQPLRDGLRRVRHRRLPDLLRHRHQDHAGEGRPHPLGDGVRQVGGGGSQLRQGSGGPRQHRAQAAGEHQARRRAGRAAARGLHRGGDAPGGHAGTRQGGAGGGRRRLRARGPPGLPGEGRQPEPRPAGDGADHVPAGPVRRGPALPRGRRVPTTPRRSPATATIWRPSPPTA